MSEIIKPEGEELLKCLNEGEPICNHCGALMDRKDSKSGGYRIYICPSCGWEVDEFDYEYESGEYEEYAAETLGVYDGDVPPVGCRACGGPYPDCISSCKVFDD